MPATAEGKGQIATPHLKSKSEYGAKWQPTAPEKTELAAIDAAVDRMRALTAPDPYVLTIPQDVEPRYHHSSRWQAQQWLCNAPFSPTEHESLQYQTFHFYEHGKQMYVQQNSRPQEPRSTASEPRSQRPGTGANTPTPAPKKKISLDAYKKKQSGQPATPEPASVTKASDALAAKQSSALKGPIERVKAETEEMLAAVAESEESNPPLRKDEAHSAKKELKRKREEREATLKEERPAKLDKHSEARPRPDHPVAQKVRRSPSPVHQSVKPIKMPPDASREPKVRPREDYDETKLPPRLSPGMPPRLSPLRHAGSPKTSQNDVTPPLPPMLSPTIPENINVTLKAREIYHSGSKDEKATRKAEEAAKRRSPVPRNGFRANSSSPAVRSDAEEKLRHGTGSASKRPQSPGLSQDDDVEVPKKAKAPKVPDMVVKLKYKKSQGEGILRIIKTRPTPAKRPPSPAPASKPVKEQKQDERVSERRNGERRDEKAGKTVAQKVPAAKKEGKVPQQDTHRTTTGEKRPLADEDRTGPSAKRRELNASESNREPSTPARSGLPSPVATSSVQRGQLPPTPSTRKDVLSQSMKREFSQESYTTQTPPAMSATPSVNGSHSQANGYKRPPGSHPSSKTPRQLAWETEQKRLEVLGRELKHAASAHTNGDASSDDSSVEQKISAVKSLESLLCYFLAFTCTDEAALSADPKQNPSVRPWRSMQGLHGFVKRKCEAFPILSGLASALGVSLNSHIISLIIQHPVDSVDTETLVHANRALLRAAQEANVKFNTDVLQRDLRRTWTARCKEEPSPTPESTNPAQLLSGHYYLPIGISTPPFQAARAAHAALNEWMKDVNLAYDLKLVII